MGSNVLNQQIIKLKILEYILKGYINAAIAINTNARTILAIGPAIEILPLTSSSISPG